MFSVYGASGRLFRGTLEQMRQIGGVHAADRLRAIDPAARDGHDSALREAAELGGAAATPIQRSALAAYATVQQRQAQHWYDLAASDVMSRRPQTLAVDATIGQAWQQLAHRGHGQAPVVNPQGVLVGMVTRASLMQIEQWPGPQADAREWTDWRGQGIGSIMITPVPSAAPATRLRLVAAALLDADLPGLPVVDDDGRISGFVSRSDLLHAALRDAGLDTWI